MSGSKKTIDKVMNCWFLKINDEWNDENKSIINKKHIYINIKYNNNIIQIINNNNNNNNLSQNNTIYINNINNI